MPGPVSPTQVNALEALVVALRGLNQAAQGYYAAFGLWPGLGQAVTRILSQPLDAVEFEQLLNFAPLQVVSGDE